jgi:hypothetical protein
MTDRACVGVAVLGVEHDVRRSDRECRGERPGEERCDEQADSGERYGMCVPLGLHADVRPASPDA